MRAVARDRPDLDVATVGLERVVFLKVPLTAEVEPDGIGFIHGPLDLQDWCGVAVAGSEWRKRVNDEQGVLEDERYLHETDFHVDAAFFVCAWHGAVGRPVVLAGLELDDAKGGDVSYCTSGVRSMLKWTYAVSTSPLSPAERT